MMNNRRRRGVPKNLFDLHARYYYAGTGDESVDAETSGLGSPGDVDAVDAETSGLGSPDSGYGDTWGDIDDLDAMEVAISIAEQAAKEQSIEDSVGEDQGIATAIGQDISEVESFKSHMQPGYSYEGMIDMPFIGKVHYSTITDAGQAMADAEDEQSGMTSIGGDTPQDYLLGEETETEEVIDDGSSSLLGGRSRRTFLPSGFWSTRPGSGVDAQRMSQEDQLLYTASPDERYQYLLSRSSEGIMPPRGYNTPSGQYIDLTLVYPDVYAPKMAEGGMIEESSMVEYDPVQIEERANMILEEAYD